MGGEGEKKRGGEKEEPPPPKIPNKNPPLFLPPRAVWGRDFSLKRKRGGPSTVFPRGGKRGAGGGETPKINGRVRVPSFGAPPGVFHLFFFPGLYCWGGNLGGDYNFSPGKQAMARVFAQAPKLNLHKGNKKVEVPPGGGPF
eukprot:FR742206.1.p2 GENE.FR742206.1~~FR742206.1.p2  ORF type:complete len:142 (-),score=78.24 FR742206.1:838-1263(-)